MVNVRISNDVGKGSEPAFYYSYKNSGSLRQMGILNMFMYVSFVYNAIRFKNDFFIDHYLTFNQYEHSLSPIFANTDFYIDFDFYGEAKENYTLAFLVNIFGFEMTKEKTNKEESSFIYSLHIDVSNFYQNIYTHILERIGKGYDTFGTANNEDLKGYFHFLDKFNQQVNMSQTKGIIPGPFSSTLCAELFMCEIDKKIFECILNGDRLGYLRNVDDLTFYSDSKEKLESVFNKVQIILNEYKLSINDNKTRIESCAFEYEESMLSDLNKAVDDFCDEIDSVSALENFKARVGQSIKNKQYSLAKGIITKLKATIIEKELPIENPRMLIDYLMKLSLTEKSLGSRCLKLIDHLIERHCDENTKNRVLEELMSKLPLINEGFSDSVIQIWFYYILNKHLDNESADILLDIYCNNTTTKNPIVLATFVKKGDGNNQNLFDVLNSETSGLSNLFYSSFCLTLIRLYSFDKNNYDSYLDGKPALMSALFDDITL